VLVPPEDLSVFPDDACLSRASQEAVGDPRGSFCGGLWSVVHKEAERGEEEQQLNLHSPSRPNLLRYDEAGGRRCTGRRPLAALTSPRVAQAQPEDQDVLVRVL
jgi:hypothetical protein